MRNMSSDITLLKLLEHLQGTNECFNRMSLLWRHNGRDGVSN